MRFTSWLLKIIITLIRFAKFSAKTVLLTKLFQNDSNLNDFEYLRHWIWIESTCNSQFLFEKWQKKISHSNDFFPSWLSFIDKIFLYRWHFFSLLLTFGKCVHEVLLKTTEICFSFRWEFNCGVSVMIWRLKPVLFSSRAHYGWRFFCSTWLGRLCIFPFSSKISQSC